MTTLVAQLPEVVRRTALAQGEGGQAWLSHLGDIVADLTCIWNLTLGPIVPGGTEALVMQATTHQGEPCILKVSPPRAPDADHELPTLLAANGCGYVKVYHHDAPRRALLLERLGRQLHEQNLPTQQQLDVICTLLKKAWTAPTAALQLPTAAEKANSLFQTIATLWPRLNKPCTAETMARARTFAGARHAAFDPAHAVLAHGDAHAWNTLEVPGTPDYKLIDPDPVRAERAYDLGVLMREWSPELLRGDPRERGRERCHHLAQRTGVDPEAIWQWGFLQRVWNGLLTLECGALEPEGREMLRVADAWATMA